MPTATLFNIFLRAKPAIPLAKHTSLALAKALEVSCYGD